MDKHFGITKFPRQAQPYHPIQAFPEMTMPDSGVPRNF